MGLVTGARKTSHSQGGMKGKERQGVVKTVKFRVSPEARPQAERLIAIYLWAARAYCDKMGSHRVRMVDYYGEDGF